MSELVATESDNDPVIKEIPVFLSKALAEKLYIFQYPVRPAKEGYENATFLKTSIKPENQEVLIEVAIDTHNVNYDQSKGEQIALNTDGGPMTETEEEKLFDSNIMDKTVLQSSRALPNCSNYAIGIFQDGELHITPLKGVIQMRPQFNYLDKSDKRARDEAKGGGEGEFEEEEEGPKQVNVTFARQKPDYMKKMQEQSFQHQTQKSLEERWIHTKYIPANGTQAELTRLEMFCSTTEQSINTLNLSSKQYLELLAPPMKDDQYSKSDGANHATSLNYIRTLPLLDQIRILMKDAKVISFVQLRCIISSEQETIAILKYLQQVAVLVQGNWVVNSELLYPKDSVSSQNGIPAELMCRARDYILLSFTEHEYLDRKAISGVIKLPAEEIKEIFVNLAKHKPKQGWHLVLPPNKDFPERYPEIAQRQELFWDAKRKHLRETMEAQNPVPQRQRRKSNRESVGSENEERNVGRARKTLRDSSLSDDSGAEPVKHKKTNRSRKVSETS